MDGLSWKIAYGDGSGASGVVFADRVKVGGVTATRQAVEAATSISAQFIEEHSDGLLGLGFGNTNTIKPTKQPTFFENIKPSLKEPLFTVTLKKNATGIYDFGYIDPQKYIVNSHSSLPSLIKLTQNRNHSNMSPSTQPAATGSTQQPATP